jgi:intracellular sulfur oxidation DsrE/DsrF family protein
MNHGLGASEVKPSAKVVAPQADRGDSKAGSAEVADFHFASPVGRAVLPAQLTGATSYHGDVMTPRRTAFGIAATALGSFGSLFVSPALAAGRHHRVVFQVSSGDVGTMNLAINNMGAMRREYESRGETVGIELVCFGPGLTMLRADISPVKQRLGDLKGMVLSACNNTLQALQKIEGQTIPIYESARVVPSGVVRLAELQEQGWSYLRP